MVRGETWAEVEAGAFLGMGNPGSCSSSNKCSTIKCNKCSTPISTSSKCNNNTEDFTDTVREATRGTVGTLSRVDMADSSLNSSSNNIHNSNSNSSSNSPLPQLQALRRGPSTSMSKADL